MSIWFVLQQEQAAFQQSEELFQRINEDDYDDAMRLIECGVDVNRFHGLLTPLHFASFAGRHSIASALIAAGAHVNTRDAYECTPLHYAAQAASVSCAQLLLDNRANVDARARGSHTALHFACAQPAEPADAERNEEEGIVRALLANGADVNALTAMHDTPLHFAATGLHIKAMRTLLDFGARADMRNSLSFTPLLVCAVRFCELRERLVELRAAAARDDVNATRKPVETNFATTSSAFDHREHTAHIGNEQTRVRNCLKLLILASGQPTLAGLNGEAMRSHRVATLLERLCCNARPLFALVRHSVRRTIAACAHCDRQVYLPCAIETLTLPQRIKEHILLTYL